MQNVAVLIYAIFDDELWSKWKAALVHSLAQADRGHELKEY